MSFSVADGVGALIRGCSLPWSWHSLVLLCATNNKSRYPSHTLRPLSLAKLFKHREKNEKGMPDGTENPLKASKSGAVMICCVHDRAAARPQGAPALKSW